MTDADTITDEQIRELLAEPPIDPPKHVSRHDKTDWAWFRREVYNIALGHGQGREACRVRCAEILNARQHEKENAMKRKKDEPPTVAADPTRAHLSVEQRQRVSSALAQLAEQMRASMSSTDVEVANAFGEAFGREAQMNRDRYASEAEDTDRMSALFRLAVAVELRFDRGAGTVMSDETSRRRELEGLAEWWSMLGVSPHAIAALLLASGARLFANLGADPDELAARIREEMAVRS